MNYKDKKILITGGTGFLGRHLTRRLLDGGAEYIRIYSRCEHRQEAMEREFNDDRLRFILGDVRDLNTLNRAMKDIDYCYHLAALKVIPKLEYAPWESVQTNIMGTYNVIEACLDNDVEKCVFTSSDKSVQALNCYGATKCVAEHLMVRANIYAGKDGTKFTCTRFGNLCGSTGSVIPLFLEQMRKKTGKITITDNRMTRFLLTKDAALDAIDFAMKETDGGEIFIPQAPSTRITNIAHVLAWGCEWKFTGIRAGEKLHEVLITGEEFMHTISVDKYYIILPVPITRKDYKWHYPDDKCTYEYASNEHQNPQWLNAPEVKELLEKEGFLWSSL